MRKFIIFLFIFSFLFSQNLYLESFKNIMQGKRIINQNPTKAQQLFTIAAHNLKQIISNSLKINKPSANAIELMGELYLNGWGVDKDLNKAKIYLCIAAKLGNFKAKNLININKFNCKKITLKEIKQ